MIRILDRSTADKIAAGEVIENPASVVKELVENSLDAGASRIRVSVSEGGKRSIRVTDDGCGIAPAGLKLAFSRFATSKLKSIDDLETIGSLGFRGEALPSIAAVARVTLTTRRKDDFHALRITVEGGAASPPVETGAPAGTEVLVEDLFYNTPGRLKFLRGGPRELAGISSLLTALALAHPACSFTLLSEGKTALRTTGDGSLLHVIGALYGGEAAAAALPLTGADRAGGISLEGYLSAPHFSRASRRWITTVVNGRVIRSPLLMGALERAYGGMLERRRHPLAVLLLQAPPEMLDVNVHPAKSEIRFHRTALFNELVYRAARSALQGLPGRESAPAWVEKQQQEWRRQQMQLLYPEGRERDSGSPPGIPGEMLHAETGEVTALPAFFRPPGGEPGDEAPAGACRFIGQFLHSYLVAQRGEDLLIIDQHAAHERVIYHALSTAGAGRKEAQLTVPLTLELPPAWRGRIEEIGPSLEEAGFKLEPFGDNSYILRAAPFPMKEGGSNAMYALLEELLQEEPAAGGESRERILRTVSCHRAVKAHQPLSRAEAEQLLKDWERTPGAAHCPHGRPAVLTFSRAELDRGFHRKGGGG